MIDVDYPNILLIVSDQHRFDWLGTNPEVPVRTPNLDALADRGVRFTNAVSPSPICGPARACLASGNEYDRCGVPSNFTSFPPSRSTYYERLRADAGYHVVGCGKFDLHKPEYTWGSEERSSSTSGGSPVGSTAPEKEMPSSAGIKD